MVPIPLVVRALAAAAVLGLQACSADAGLGQGPLASTGRTPAAPNFVAASRPDKLDFIPVAAPGPDVAPSVRSAAEIAAAEAELEHLRARNEIRGAAARRAAGAAKPASQP